MSENGYVGQHRQERGSIRYNGWMTAMRLRRERGEAPKLREGDWYSERHAWDEMTVGWPMFRPARATDAGNVIGYRFDGKSLVGGTEIVTR